VSFGHFLFLFESLDELLFVGDVHAVAAGERHARSALLTDRLGAGFRLLIDG